MIGTRLAAPVLLAVAGTVAYHVAQKLTSPRVHPMLSLGISFLTAGLACLLFLGISKGRGALATAPDLSWAAFALGASIIAIECGFLLAYRRGIAMNRAALVVNVVVAIVLIAVGRAAFGEALTGRAGVGIALCLVGLWLLL